ncbi:hypothetical protein GCM10012275_08200 [Longimycelium tulufanense]|uniref:Sec-independent protein translocase protein TatA n=1 Tax=Longimycelium tulufanense TaxID=907463 RepID=A0A8J3CAL3_9PSEU|nr:Sec-independent protein translocase subunit TatA [Longimycelium tulufanense]GGM39691.1 hypothetical protein GCM10012275_08200 [Longimycelium tulufanense]
MLSGGLSLWHWLVVAGVFVLLFGAKKLPDSARALGRSMRILRSELGADRAETEPTTPPAPPQVSGGDVGRDGSRATYDGRQQTRTPDPGEGAGRG